MGSARGPFKLPEGYRLDLADDPDAPALRRSDGTVVARFGARGMTHEAIEREALEDLLRGAGSPGVGIRALRGAPWATIYLTPLRGKPLMANFLELSHGEVRRNRETRSSQNSASTHLGE